MMQMSSLVPRLLIQVRQLREQIKNGGTETRTMEDLSRELEIKADLLKGLLNAATPIKNTRRLR